MQQITRDASSQLDDQGVSGNDNSSITISRKKTQLRHDRKTLSLRGASYLFHLDYQVVDDSEDTSSVSQFGTSKGSSTISQSNERSVRRVAMFALVSVRSRENTCETASLTAMRQSLHPLSE